LRVANASQIATMHKSDLSTLLNRHSGTGSSAQEHHPGNARVRIVD